MHSPDDAVNDTEQHQQQTVLEHGASAPQIQQPVEGQQVSPRLIAGQPAQADARPAAA